MKKELLKLINALELNQQVLMKQNNALQIQNRAILSIIKKLELETIESFEVISEDDYMNNLRLELKNKGINVDLIEYSLGSFVTSKDLYNHIYPSKVIPPNVFGRIIKPYLLLLNPDIIITRRSNYRSIKNIKLKLDTFDQQI